MMVPQGGRGAYAEALTRLHVVQRARKEALRATNVGAFCRAIDSLSKPFQSCAGKFS